MEITVDMSQAKEFTLLPEGTYEVQIQEEPEHKTSAKGTQYLKWQLVLTGADDCEEYEGQKLFLNTMITGAGAGITKGFLEAAGVDFSSREDEDGKVVALGFRTEDLIGRYLIATVKQKVYEGKQMNEVKGVAPIPTDDDNE